MRCQVYCTWLTGHLLLNLATWPKSIFLACLKPASGHTASSAPGYCTQPLQRHQTQKKSLKVKKGQQILKRIHALSRTIYNFKNTTLDKKNLEPW